MSELAEVDTAAPLTVELDPGDGAVFLAAAERLSDRGVFIRDWQRLRRGARVHVAWSADGAPRSRTAEVVWSTLELSLDAPHPGVQLRFLG